MSANQVLALGLSNDGSTITQLFVAPGTSSTKASSEATEILDATRDSLLQNFQRKNIEGTLGRWSCLKKSRCTYIGLTRSSYPERLVYQMLNVG